MISVPNMLIIGAAGRNVGKTEFACALIEQNRVMDDVYGVKITTVAEKDGQCPRGGDGCGVCSSLKGNFMITEEITGDPKKDTVRMLQAGAKKVFWLRVLKEHLEEGFNALLESIPANACVVCESNSARLVAEPGLFLVVQEAGSTKIKASCKNVIEQANRVFNFTGSGWDFMPDEVVFEDQRWRFKSPKT